MPLPERISLDENNPTLKDVLDHAQQLANKPASELNPEQLALLQLHKTITRKPTGFSNDCFICFKGA